MKSMLIIDTPKSCYNCPLMAYFETCKAIKKNIGGYSEKRHEECPLKPTRNKKNMANNRMFIRCRHCGETFMIGGHMGTGWSMTNCSDKSFLERLNNFYEEHAFCNKDENENNYFPKFKKIDKVHSGCYDICYETNDWE
jgi:hypothetical protein